MKGDSLEGLVGSSALAHESRHADNFGDGVLYNSGPLPKRGLMERLRRIAKSSYGRISAGALAGIAALTFAYAKPGKAEANNLINESGNIANYVEFIDTCPKNDPAYSQIKEDFKIRRNGVLVDADNVYCSEPVSQIPPSQVTTELLLLQALRVLYYMDLGQEGHLTWTNGNDYDWIKSKVKGFDITDQLPDDYASCCGTYEDGKYVHWGRMSEIKKSAWNNLDWKLSLDALLLDTHEVRHLDPPHDDHLTCNGMSADPDYDPNNPSAWGVMRYLIGKILDGEINLGIKCTEDKQKENVILNQIFWDTNSYGVRFCNTKPPILLTMPDNAGGYCEGGTITGTVTDESGSALEAIVKAVDPVNDKRVYATVFSKPDGTFIIERPGKGAGDFRFKAGADECYLEKWYSTSSSGNADIVTVMDRQTVPLTGIKLDANDNIAGPSVQGAQSGIKGQTYAYTAVRNSTSANPVKYKFVWGDGTSTEWQAGNAASHTYSSTGNYPVTALTKCELHGIESKVGEPLQVSIANPSGPDLTGEFRDISYACKSKKGVQQCTLYGIFTVENIGDQPSQPSNVRFYFSNDASYDELGDVILKQLNQKKGLSPGAVQNLKPMKAKLDPGIDPKDQYVIAVVTSAGDVDAGNNIVIYKIQ